MVNNGAAGTPDWSVPVPQFLSLGAPWRLVAGGGCAACAQRGSLYSKAVRCSSPIRWAAACSWWPGTARASPGRSAPGQARSLTRGAQVRRLGLLALDLGELLTPTSDLETPGLDPQAATSNPWPESSAGPLISACTLEADCPSPDLPFHPRSLPGSPSPPTRGSVSLPSSPGLYSLPYLGFLSTPIHGVSSPPTPSSTSLPPALRDRALSTGGCTRVSQGRGLWTAAPLGSLCLIFLLWKARRWLTTLSGW